MANACVSSECSRVRVRLAALEGALMCTICHALPTAPVALQNCGHIFCSYCIRRFLGAKSRCPEPYCGLSATTTSLIPLRALDCATVLETSRRRFAAGKRPPESHPSYLVHLTSANANKQLLRTSLAKVGLSDAGSFEELIARYREYVLLFNANIDSAVMEDIQVVVEHVKQWEQTLISEKQKTLRRQNEARGIASLFRRDPNSSGRRKRRMAKDCCNEQDRELFLPHASSDDNENDGDSGTMFMQGDGFSDLIRKAKIRKTLAQETKKNIAENLNHFVREVLPAHDAPNAASQDYNGNEKTQCVLDPPDIVSIDLDCENAVEHNVGHVNFSKPSHSKLVPIANNVAEHANCREWDTALYKEGKLAIANDPCSESENCAVAQNGVQPLLVNRDMRGTTDSSAYGTPSDPSHQEIDDIENVKINKLGQFSATVFGTKSPDDRIPAAESSILSLTNTAETPDKMFKSTERLARSLYASRVDARRSTLSYHAEDVVADDKPTLKARIRIDNKREVDIEPSTLSSPGAGKLSSVPEIHSAKYYRVEKDLPPTRRLSYQSSSDSCCKSVYAETAQEAESSDDSLNKESLSEKTKERIERNRQTAITRKIRLREERQRLNLGSQRSS